MFVALVKVIFITLVEALSVIWVRKNGGESFLERAREPYGMLLLTNQFHGLFEGLIALVCDLAQKK